MEIEMEPDFRYYIILLADGNIKGTNDYNEAADFASSENVMVIDKESNELLLMDASLTDIGEEFLDCDDLAIMRGW